MSEKNDFQNAVILLSSGRRKQAAKAFMCLYDNATDAGFKLNIIDMLMSCLDPIREVDKLLQVVNDGINIAQQLNRQDLVPHLLGAKATYVMKQISNLKYRQHSLKLMPYLWINFATETERDEYEHLSRAIRDGEAEVHSLVSKATMLARQAADRIVQAYVLMATGDVHQSRFMNLKMDAMTGKSTRAKWWLRLEPLRQRGLEHFLFFTFGQIRLLRDHLSQVAECYLAAAELFREINDPREAHAFYNLANHLRIAYQFRRAMKYLKKARIVAQNHNEHLLLKQIDELARIVRAKNKDVPDYLEGEKREEITV
jgi:hypothetical protein